MSFFKKKARPTSARPPADPGLSNLAANVATWEDAGVWLDVVRRPFDLVLETEGDPQFGLSDHTLEAAVYVRLTMVGPELRSVLVALPERKQVLYRVIRGAEALPAIAEMATSAASVHRTTAGSLTPHVFLVDDGGWHELTEIEGDTIKIMISDEASAALEIDPPA